jgi:hypothetical protein
MKAEDAADLMDQEKVNDRFKQRAAVGITRPRTSARPTTTSRLTRSNWRSCRTEASTPRRERP